MNLDEAISTRKSLTHLIGTHLGEEIIGDIIVIPNDTDLFGKAMELYTRDYNWELISSLYTSVNDHLVLFVLNKSWIMSRGMLIHRELGSALVKYDIDLKYLTDGGTFDPLTK